MIKLYLEPLQDEALMSESELASLFGNIQEIYEFQREFLQALEDAIDHQDQPLDTLETPKQIKVRKTRSPDVLPPFGKKKVSSGIF